MPRHSMNLSWDEVLAPYQTIFFDAYGVLLDDTGPFPEAIELLRKLKKTGKALYLLSNGAARTREQVVRDNQAAGLPFALEETFTSGWLLQNILIQPEWSGAKVFVFGSKDPKGLLGNASVELVADPEGPFDTFVLANQIENLLPVLSLCVTTMIRRLQQGQQVRLLLPNPDTLFPKNTGTFGLTAGALAPLVEAAIHSACYGLRDLPRFVCLGKPEAPLYEAALAHSGRGKTVMIGDQLATDIKGACHVGIDSVLVQSGIFRGDETFAWPHDAKPHYLATRFGGRDACVKTIG